MKNPTMNGKLTIFSFKLKKGLLTFIKSIIKRKKIPKTFPR